MDAALPHNVDRYAGDAFKAEYQKIVDASTQEMAALPTLGKGNSAYSTYGDDRYVRLYVQRIRDLVLAKTRTLLDAYELYETPLDGRILTVVTKFKNETLAGMSAAAKGHSSLVAARTGRNQQQASAVGQAFEQRLTRDTRNLLGEAACLLEERRVRLRPKKQITTAAVVPKDGTPPEQAVTHRGLSIFISHSSKDADLALAVIDLLKAGLGLTAEQIRCSSVDGYRLPVGVNTESKLREEVNAARIVIGLITPSSLESYYVMFELGARWGAELFLAPLLAGVQASDLAGPLGLLNALSAHTEAQLHQLLKDVSERLETPLQNAPSYLRNISAVKELADATAKNSSAAPASTRAPVPHFEIEHEERAVLLDDYDVFQLDTSPEGIAALLVSFYYDPSNLTFDLVPMPRPV